MSQNMRNKYMLANQGGSDEFGDPTPKSGGALPPSLGGGTPTPSDGTANPTGRTPTSPTPGGTGFGPFGPATPNNPAGPAVPQNGGEVPTDAPATSTIVGPPSIDEAARAREEQDKMLRRRGRQNFMLTGPQGAGSAPSFIRFLSGYGNDPVTRNPGRPTVPIGSGRNDNPTGRPEEPTTPNPVERPGSTPFGPGSISGRTGRRKSCSFF